MVWQILQIAISILNSFGILPATVLFPKLGNTVNVLVTFFCAARLVIIGVNVPVGRTPLSLFFGSRSRPNRIRARPPNYRLAFFTSCFSIVFTTTYMRIPWLTLNCYYLVVYKTNKLFRK